MRIDQRPNAVRINAACRSHTSRLQVRRGRWKLYKHHDGTPPALFDLESDPGETRSLLDTHPVRAGYLRQLLRRELTRGEPLAGETAELDAESRRSLEALGYL